VPINRSGGVEIRLAYNVFAILGFLGQLYFGVRIYEHIKTSPELDKYNINKYRWIVTLKQYLKDNKIDNAVRIQMI
jgi:hypothetical protein